MNPVILDLPFRGRWLVQNSPAHRVPSHGTDLFGVTYAIDFVAVDAGGRSAPWGWRSLVATESEVGFAGFGAPILAPAAGTVVVAHDGELDHRARRSQLVLIPYALGQARRARQGMNALAGNHVVVALSPGGPYVAVVHLRHGSVQVRVGDQVGSGTQLAECGNSGNSTEPHVHVQVTDSFDWATAHGLPLAFRGVGPGGTTGVPANGSVVSA